MKRTIIGLTGAKGGGKTTSFGIIQAEFPTVQEITLANRLKNASAEVLGILRSHFDDPAVKEKEMATPVTLNEENVTKIIEFFDYKADFELHVRPHMNKVLHTPRQVAQYVGTEILRNVDEQIHCKGAVLGLPEDGIFVVTDMRFWNEFNFFNDNPDVDFYPLYISNNHAEAKAAGDNHPSERYVLEIAKRCQRIDNNGSLAALQEQLLTFMNGVVQGRG